MKSEKTFIQELGEFSTWTAVASFAVGTLLFIGYYFFDTEACLYAGISYTVLAFFGNCALLLLLLVNLIRNRDDANYIIQKILIQLANIPVVVLYIYLIFTMGN